MTERQVLSLAPWNKNVLGIRSLADRSAPAFSLSLSPPPPLPMYIMYILLTPCDHELLINPFRLHDLMHLVTLYPNKSKDEVFGKYYSPAPSESRGNFFTRLKFTTHAMKQLFFCTPPPVHVLVVTVRMVMKCLYQLTPFLTHPSISLCMCVIKFMELVFMYNVGAELRDGYLPGDLRQTIPAS